MSKLKDVNVEKIIELSKNKILNIKGFSIGMDNSTFKEKLTPAQINISDTLVGIHINNTISEMLKFQNKDELRYSLNKIIAKFQFKYLTE